MSAARPFSAALCCAGGCEGGGGHRKLVDPEGRPLTLDRKLMAQRRPKKRQKLVHAEGLRDVVVGTEVEGFDFARLVSPARQDHDGNMLVALADDTVLRNVTDAYAKRVGIDLEPDYEVDNISMAISLIVSTGGIALMPLYARNLLPPTVVSRALEGESPLIDIALGYRRDGPLPGTAAVVSRIKHLRLET